MCNKKISSTELSIHRAKIGSLGAHATRKLSKEEKKNNVDIVIYAK